VEAGKQTEILIRLSVNVEKAAGKVNAIMIGRKAVGTQLTGAVVETMVVVMISAQAVILHVIQVTSEIIQIPARLPVNAEKAAGRTNATTMEK